MMFDEARPEEIDPEVAVRGQENMGDYLDRLSGPDREEFGSNLTELARKLDVSDPAVAKSVRRIPFSLGWDEHPGA